MKVLVVADNFNLGKHLIPNALKIMGIETVFARMPTQAAEALKDQSIKFTLVDGDLGDSDRSTKGMSGVLIEQHLLNKRPFARITCRPETIPAEHCGLFVWNKKNGSTLRELLQQNLQA